MLNLKSRWQEYHETSDPNVRDEIILASLPLVKFVVGKLVPSPDADKEELVQSGIFGLIDALERYNPDRNVKFETYAILRIRGAVIDELRSRNWVPREKRKLARRIHDAQNRLHASGAAFGLDDLASEINLTPQELDDILQETLVSFISLDDHRTGSGDNPDNPSILDSVADMSARDPHDHVELEERVRALSRAIVSLPEQERIITTLYYYENMKLKDIADLYGVSESRISQIHSRAIILLRLKLQQLLSEKPEPADHSAV